MAISHGLTESFNSRNERTGIRTTAFYDSVLAEHLLRTLALLAGLYVWGKKVEKCAKIATRIFNEIFPDDEIFSRGSLIFRSRCAR